MLRQIYLALFTFALAIVGGAWSVDYVLRHFDGFGRLQIGQWNSFPHNGEAGADPYARARRAKFETLALGRSEGLVFTLWHDDEGKPLHLSCSYRLEGMIPDASFFTLYAVDSEQRPKKSHQGWPDEINSDNVLRRERGDYLITISPRPQGGNWLGVEATTSGEDSRHEYYGLVLTLYDTPITTITGMAQLVMPSLNRMDDEAAVLGGGCG